MKNKKRFLWIFAVLSFALTLYLVEASSFGSMEVAKHNGGYGTFDMKKYDYKTVEEVLKSVDEEGISAYHRYYFVDFIFILSFGLLQCMISDRVYQKRKKLYRGIAVGVPIARGIFDVVENSLLLITINSYPRLSAGVITIAGAATGCKLWCIRIWAALVLGGLLASLLQRVFSKKKK